MYRTIFVLLWLSYSTVAYSQLNIGNPGGLVESTNKYPELLSIAQGFTSPSYRVVAVLITKEDEKRLSNGKKPLLKRYAFIKSGRQKNFRIDLSTFASTNEKMLSQLNTRKVPVINVNAIFKRKQEELAANLKAEGLLNIKAASFVGELTRTDFTGGWLIASRLETTENNYNYTILNGMFNVYVNGEFYLVDAYSVLNDYRDIEWMSVFTRDLDSATKALNR
jgi:hypothetical protein